MIGERSTAGSRLKAGWRWREREWSWWAASLAVCALVFSLWPGLDLWAAGLFLGPDGFVGEQTPLVRGVYRVVPWVGRISFLLALALILTGALSRRALGQRWWRRLLLLGLSMTFGVGLVVNGPLKEGWGRARPVNVAEFNGPAHFTPALRPAKECRTNCSFVTGHGATGFALAAVGLLSAPATRRRWLAAGMATGLVLGVMRMSQGAHFLSDVLFAGLAVWGTELAIRAVWLRWVARHRRRQATV
jgi:membrane-associated PAP2 superfamily phosphatase